MTADGRRAPWHKAHPPRRCPCTPSAVFPDTGLPQCLTQPKHSDDECKQTVFHTKNVRWLSEAAVVAPADVAPRAVGGALGGHGDAHRLLGRRARAVPVPCRTAPLVPACVLCVQRCVCLPRALEPVEGRPDPPPLLRPRPCANPPPPRQPFCACSMPSPKQWSPPRKSLSSSASESSSA